MTQNWRIETDAYDYFSHRKKAADLADRRPVIRKAADLVGPGIDANAVRITDFNDQLARYNGYFSAKPDAINGPTSAATIEVGWVGLVSSDAALGGVQVFTDLATGARYQRVFRRSEFDPTYVLWGDWTLL